MAQNIEHKKSTLDDGASIYQRKDEREDSKSIKEKWASLNGKEKRQYFKDYFLGPILLGTFILGLVIYFIYSMFITGHTSKFMLAVLGDDLLDNTAMEGHLDTLSEHWDFSKKEKADYDTQVAVNKGVGATTGESTFLTYLYADSMNAVIGTKDELEKYGYYFTDFKAELSEDILSQIPEEAWCELTYETQSPDTAKETVTTYSAIYLKYTIFADNIVNSAEEDELILVIPLSTGDKKDKINYNMDFFKYAMGLELGD
ncbi:MAG: hypothetical protein IJZ25_02400 [Lachnospiraceae bacterium]|nr:hypothetical protein [Lachnospiraceae bacterium]